MIPMGQKSESFGSAIVVVLFFFEFLLTKVNKGGAT